MAEEQKYSAPLAKKVKLGNFSSSELTLETTSAETARLPWEKIKFVILGRIEEQPSAPSAPARKLPDIRPGKVLGGLIAGPFGTAAYDLINRKKEKPVPSRNEKFLLLYLYAAGEIHPYLFDSLGTNFKTFLNEEAGYSGELNLFLFVRKLSLSVPAALDFDLTVFLEKGKNYIPVFSSRDEFSRHANAAYQKRTT